MKFLLAFGTIFLSELGCKTQMTTLLLSSNKTSNVWMVFVLTSTALLIANGFAAVLGNFASKHIDVIPMKLIAGIGFVILGIITIVEHCNGVGHHH